MLLNAYDELSLFSGGIILKADIFENIFSRKMGETDIRDAKAIDNLGFFEKELAALYRVLVK